MKESKLHFADSIMKQKLSYAGHVLRGSSGNKKLITRWDSERELFYDDIVHALQNNNIYGSIAEVCYHAKIHC